MKEKKGASLIAIAIIILIVIAIGIVIFVVINNNGTKIDEAKTDNVSISVEKEQTDKTSQENKINTSTNNTSKESDFYCLENGKGGMVLMEYLGTAENVILPETYKGLPVVGTVKYTFANDVKIKTIKICNSLKEISGYWCGLNNNLETLICGSSLEKIGDSAFQGCENLKEVSLNEGLKIIEAYAFALCKELKTIYIPDSVDSISSTSFYGHPDDFTILGKAGSYAEQFCKLNNIKFVVE